MRKEFENAQRILSERFQWETKIRKFTIMVADGLPRLGRTGQWQADLHYPTIDMAIRKLLPFDLGQITSGNRIFNFNSLQQQTEALTSSAADFLDFTLWNNTNFARTLREMVYQRRLKGKGIIKATVDPLNEYKIIFESIDPMFLLMPQTALGFEEADEWIHVREFTVDSYKRLDSRWKTDDATIKKIRGSRDFQSLGIYNKNMRLREGITNTSREDSILIFEHWVKTLGGHTIYNYSPHQPDIDLRQPHGNPHKWQRKESIPFFEFPMEVAEDGWYAPRGLGEILDVFEQFNTKVMNEWTDDLTLRNRPVFTGDKEILNTTNLRWEAGQYIGGNIRTVRQDPPAVPYEKILQFGLGIAEQLSASPDFGITKPGQGDSSDPRTATENNRIAALQSAGATDNAMLLREDLAKLGRHVWGMICQFKEREFTYFATGEIKVLPEEVLHDKYLITVDGSPDGWNRAAKFQKSLMAMQTFMPLPNSNPDYWVREAMAAYDSKAPLQGFQPTGQKQQSEYAQQVIVINAMLAPSHGRPSFPAPINQNDDQSTRIKADMDWLHACSVLGVPPDPQAIQRVHQDITQRLQILQKQNPAAAKQIQQMIQQMEAPNVQQMPNGEQPAEPAMAQ